MSSSRSRRSKRGDFFAVRRDAVVFVGSLALLCGASVAAGAALPPIHKAAAHAGAQAAGLSPASTAAFGGPAVVGPIDHVARPWKAGQPQLGIDVYWAEKSAESDAVVDEKIRNTVNYAVGLGANWISLSFPFVTVGIDADQVAASPAMTPTTAGLKAFIAAARAAGLQVALRPILDETSLVKQDPNAWRGSIVPANFAAWFSSYQAFLTPYTQLAQETGVGAFYVSTELTSMEGFTDDWAALMHNLQKVYTGPVYDSVNYDRLKPQDPRIPDASLAVDAYFPLSGLEDDATVAELVAGWDTWLDGYDSGDLSGLTISEAGIMPEDGAYSHPFSWHAAGTVNPQIQINWYKAACEVAQQRHVAGLYWWYLNLENADEPANTPASADPMSFLNTQGAAVIKTCFSGFAS